MRFKLLAMSVVVALWAWPASAQHHGGYEWRTFDVPGADSTSVQSVNDRGDLAGWYVSGGVTHGFIVRRGEMTTIDAPVEGTFMTAVQRISPTGTAVGYFRTAGTCPTCPSWLQDFQQHAFTWHRGHFTVMDMPGAAYTMADGINAWGDIVGEIWDGKAYGFAFRNGRYTRIDVSEAPADPMSWSAAYAVNAHGDIVGWRGDGATFTFSGYLLHRGRVIDIDIPGYTWTLAMAINDRGEVVVVGMANWMVQQSFIWRNGGLTEVRFPGANRTQVFDIDECGDLVGTYEGADGAAHGFVAWKKGPGRR